MKISNYKEAVKYLETFIKPVSFARITANDAKQKDPLARMRRLLELLGNPQNEFKSILIAGTSGKGSTAYLISHILTNAGYKTGLTISPHLQKVNERIQINEVPISDEKFTEIFTLMIRIIRVMKKEGEEPSYFEILIAMAFLYFAKEKVDIVVAEVGMGGKFDATNTLNPLISVLTNVSLDHTNILGKTVLQIAKEKAGIIKKYYVSSRMYQAEKGVHNTKYIIPATVVTGVKQSSVIKLVEEKCKEVGAQLFRLGKEFNYEIKKEDQNGTVFEFYSSRELKISSRSASPDSIGASWRTSNNNILDNLSLSLLGKHQVENACLALEVVSQLKKSGFKISDDVIKKSLKTSFFPGRFEINEFKIKNLKFKIILDGAHNPEKMKAFLKTLKKFRGSTRGVGARKLIFIVGFKSDKDIKRMLKQISGIADVLILTEFNSITDVNKNGSQQISNLKSQIAKLISNIKNKKLKIYFEKDSKNALKKTMSLVSSKEDLIVVTGSLYLVGEVRNLLSIGQSTSPNVKI